MPDNTVNPNVQMPCSTLPLNTGYCRRLRYDV